MSGVTLRPFADGHLETAGALLAKRHRRHRTAESLLPARFEDAAAAQVEVERAWRRGGAAGAVALRGRRLVGYLIGAPGEEAVWGPNGWVGLAGHAVDDAEVVRDLYAHLAERWLEEGRSRHYALVPAVGALLESWYRLGFGQQQAYGVSEVAAQSWPQSVREARPGDVEALLPFARMISQHHAASPVFSDHAARQTGRRESDLDEVRTTLEEDIAAAEIGTLVAEVDGRLAGFFELAPVEYAGKADDGHGPLALPEAACYLAFATTAPELRGSGAGLQLTNAAFAWAYRSGYATMVTDWRVTNLLSSRFWPRRGFRLTFLRLYRSIP